MAESRHYIVTTPSGRDRLVLAQHPAHAVRFVVDSMGIKARVAEKDDLVRLLTDGITRVEVAKSEAAAEPSAAE